MDWKETVITDEQIEACWDRNTIGLTFKDLRLISNTQAKISFEAGRREVVEWINKNGLECASHTNPDEYVGFHKLSWQAQLKEWGIGE